MKKTVRSSRPLDRVALISTPWPLFNRPSIQLGALKAFVNVHIPDLNVSAHHFYLEVAEAIGYPLYEAVSERTWSAEAIYAALLYPERIDKIRSVFNREAAGKPHVKKMDIDTLVREVETVSNTFIDQMDWESFGLVGFSVCFCQLTSSLYFIRQIKKKAPDIRIAVGGSTFVGESIQNLIRHFPQIDYAVFGEGESPLVALIRCLREAKSPNIFSSIPGVFTVDSKGGASNFFQLPDMNRLPPPVYNEYFQVLSSFAPSKTFFPTIPTEISRGCWWRKGGASGKASGCAFCNLNLQWEGYRTKGAAQVLSEIDHLISKHRSLSLAFMDNLLPVNMSNAIFSNLAELKKDLRLFGEIRANTPADVLEVMKSGGIHEVQIGIEALSTSLLRKLNKGTTAIQNLEVMKNCEELSIGHNSNLILHFPGSDLQDVEETLKTLDFAWPFRPLRCVHFWLGYGSPVWQRPKSFGIHSISNHSNYAAFFPKNVFNSVTFMIQSYRGDLGRQRKLWQPVKQKVRDWKRMYAALHQAPGWDPILSFRDGKEFLIIRQRRIGGDPFTHRLVGTSRLIYLFCRKHRSIKSITDRFAGLPSENIRGFLRMMVNKKLMFEEQDHYLSLAVRVE